MAAKLYARQKERASPQYARFQALLRRVEHEGRQAPAIVDAIRRARGVPEDCPREWITPAVASALSDAAETEARHARALRCRTPFAIAAGRFRLPPPLASVARRVAMHRRATEIALYAIDVAMRLSPFQPAVMHQRLTHAIVSLATCYRLSGHHEIALLTLNQAAQVVCGLEDCTDRLNLQSYEAAFVYLERIRNLLALGLLQEADVYLHAARRLANAYGNAHLAEQCERLSHRIAFRQQRRATH